MVIYPIHYKGMLERESLFSWCVLFTLLYLLFRINCLHTVHPFLLVIELGLRVFSGGYSSKALADEEDEATEHPHTHEGCKLMSAVVRSEAPTNKHTHR